MEKAAIYLPTRYGLIYEDVENRYPMGSRDAPEKASEYAENWIAFEGEVGRRYTVGAIWPREPRELIVGGTSLAFPRLKIKVPANGRVVAPPYHIYADEGSWEGLRETWRKLIEGTVEQEKRYLDVAKRRPLAFGFTHNIVSPALGSVAGTLEVSHLRAKEVSGSVAIHPPDGWKASPAGTNFRKLSWRRQHRRRVVFIPPKYIRPGVFEGRLVLETNEMRKGMEFPIVLLGRGRVSIGSIKDQGRDAIRVSNGNIEFRICRSFGGTIYSLKRDGIEHLHSAFPNDRPFLWYNPWYGGLSAPPSGDASNGWQESFACRRVTRGLWKGVEISCRPGKFAKQAKGLVVKSRYLTAG